MEATTPGVGVEVAAEGPVEMIRRPHTTTNRLGAPRHRRQGLLRVNKDSGLDSGQVRWAVLPPAILLVTGAETSKREIKAGAMGKVGDSLEEEIEAGVLEIMQEKGVRCGVRGPVLDLRDPPSRRQGMKALVSDPLVVDESLCYGKCRCLSVFLGVLGIWVV